MPLLTNPRYQGAARTQFGSGTIWGDLPADIDQQEKGWHRFYDLTDIPKHSTTSGGSVTANLGPFAAYLDQGGFIRPPSTGSLLAGKEIGSDGDNECVTLIADGKILLAGTSPAAYFECEFKKSTISATKHGSFIGITESGVGATDVLLTDADAMADRNLIGFHQLETGGTIDFVWKADGQTAQTGVTTLATLVADTYMRLGFKLIPVNPTTKRIQLFVNGTPYTTTYVTTTQMAAATFPSDVNMGLGLSVNNATATTPGYSTFLWARLAQLAY